MIYPKQKKITEPSVSTAAGYLKHIKTNLTLPENIILCPVSALTRPVQNNYKTRRYTLDGDIYVFEAFNAAFVTNFGQGTPAAAMIMETLTALGGKNFYLTGYAGTLQKEMKVGDIVLCSKALRDEGVSANYIAEGPFAHPSETLNNKLKTALAQKEAPFITGPTWTTDTLFRETEGEIRHYQQNGILTVEMEAAAVFAIAEFHKVNACAMFAVSDSLANYKWEPAFGHDDIHKSMRKILEIFLESTK